MLVFDDKNLMNMRKLCTEASYLVHTLCKKVTFVIQHLQTFLKFFCIKIRFLTFLFYYIYTFCWYQWFKSTMDDQIHHGIVEFHGFILKIYCYFVIYCLSDVSCPPATNLMHTQLKIFFICVSFQRGFGCNVWLLMSEKLTFRHLSDHVLVSACLTSAS